MVEIRSVSKDLVRPESRIPLTPSDYEWKDKFGFGIFLFDSSAAAPAATMKSSLARVLMEFRQLAGRVSAERGCILLTDEGVSFEQAMATGCTVEDIVRTRDFTGLLPEVPNAEELFSVKYTSMDCGGAALATAGHHIVMDACSYWNFMESWAKLAGCEALQDGFVMDRTPMMPRESLQLHPNPVSIVSFNKEELDLLKSNSQDATLSTFECLAGHLWKCASTALKQQTSSSVAIFMNTRKLLSLPKDFFGNALTMVFPTCNAQDLLNEPWSFAAKRIHDTLRGVKAEELLMDVDERDFYWRRGKEEWEQHWGQCVFVINSWVGFPMYQCDFGQGKPDLVSIAHKPLDRSIFIQPARGNKGLEVHIALQQEHLDIMLGLIKEI